MKITIQCACQTVRLEAEQFTLSDDEISYFTDGQWTSVELEDDFCPECGEAYEYNIKD